MKTVSSALGRRNTPLKRGVNESHPRPRKILSCAPRRLRKQNGIAKLSARHIFGDMKSTWSIKGFALLTLVIGQVMIAPMLSRQPAFAAEAVVSTPDLSGTVKSTDSRVITNASIFIYTAGPRMGTGYL